MAESSRWGLFRPVTAERLEQISQGPIIIWDTDTGIFNSSSSKRVTIGKDVETEEELWIGDRERCGGLYVLGKPRTGKSHLLKSMSLQDMKNGHGLLFIDPHEDAINDILDRLPERRKDEVILLDPTDAEYTFGINPLYCRNPNDLRERQLSFGQAWDVFVKVFAEEDGRLGILLSRYLGNCLYPLIENQGYSLYDIWAFLQDKTFRDTLLSQVTYHAEVIDFWHDEFDQMPSRDQREEIQSLLRRIDVLRRNPYIKHVISQATPKIDFADVMQRKQIVLLRMPPWQDEESKAFIGTLVISQLLKTIFLRAEISEHLRTPFAIYCDEFQTFATPDFAKLFTQTGKFQIMPTVAHQERFSQFKPGDPNRGATLASPNKVLFSLTVHDSDELAPEIAGPADDVKTRVGGELVISPRPVEDIWERGHPNKEIMQIRQRYFWLVDLLKSKPQEKYFVFNPANAERIASEGNQGKLHWQEFQDWEMYRSSAEMVREGIALLNRYYCDRMYKKPMTKNNYNDSPKTDEEIRLILRVIECLGGVLGFRPTMRPFLPDEMRQLLANLWREKRKADREEQIRLVKEELSQLCKPDKRNYEHGSFPGSLYWDDMEKYWQLRRDLTEKIEFIRKDRPEPTIDDVNRYIPPEKAKTAPAFYVGIGVPPQTAENMIEWEVTPLPTLEQEALTELVTLAANIGVNKAAYDQNWPRVYHEYTKIMAFYKTRERFGDKYPQLDSETTRPYLQQVTERLVWQMTELQEFVLMVFGHCPRALEREPLHVTSGQYDETPRRERTQSEVIVETAQALANLPRFTAYAKVIQERAGEQIVLKRKIQPLPLPKEHGLPLASEILARSHAAVYRPRNEIEVEIRERQEQWRRRPETGKLPQPRRKKPPPISE